MEKNINETFALALEKADYLALSGVVEKTVKTGKNIVYAEDLLSDLSDMDWQGFCEGLPEVSTILSEYRDASEEVGKFLDALPRLAGIIYQAASHHNELADLSILLQRLKDSWDADDEGYYAEER